MDKMIYYTGHYPRQFNLIPPVSDFGYLPGKMDHINQTFKTCNFSFILNGDGWYTIKNSRLKVKAPAILLQWPDENMDYGPDDSWDEFFFMYSGHLFDQLISSGLFNPQKPVIPMNGFPEVKKILNEINVLLNTGSTVFPADRLDLLCWRAVSESRFSSSQSVYSQQEATITTIADRMQENPLGEFDFEQIASESGMAFSTFRRYWIRYIGISPSRYLSDLKLTEACKMLIETDLSIGEISRNIHFEDPLYFSRFFRKKTGLTASEYRKNHFSGQ